MNIFYFNSDPSICARQHCDKHTVKMIVEYAQLLSTAHRVLDGTQVTIKTDKGRKKTIWTLDDCDFEDALYAATHINHPSAKWTRHSYSAYSWLTNLFIQLCLEYSKRYGKTHKTTALTTYFLNAPRNIPKDIPFTPPWRAMPDEFKLPKTLDEYCEKSYQLYFNSTKQHIARWKHDEIPEWFIHA